MLLIQNCLVADEIEIIYTDVLMFVGDTKALLSHTILCNNISQFYEHQFST